MRRIVVIAVACLMAMQARAQMQSGRLLEDRNTFSIGLTFGSVFGLDGEVQETTRPIEVIGGPTSGAPPEDYSWKELGFDEDATSFGLHVEKMWRFVTLQAQGSYAEISANGIADRDYFIGVEKVSFGGQSYEYMVIPRGPSYKGDIESWIVDLRVLITPVSFGTPETPQFTPWLHIGLFSFIGDYTIDAGRARGVTQYENPPRDYVIGGKGTGSSGFVVPSIGGGGELYLPVSDALALSLQAHIAFLKYGGSSGDFGVSSRNEKAVDVDYLNYGLRLLVEIALSDAVDLIAGVEYQHWEGDAEVKAKDRSEEDILARREKFDKDVSFEMSSLMGIVGVRF